MLKIFHLFFFYKYTQNLISLLLPPKEITICDKRKKKTISSNPHLDVQNLYRVIL